MPESLGQSTIKKSKTQQNRRLNSKFKERLGHSSIYSQRNPQTFFQFLSPEEKAVRLQELNLLYREILANYFRDEELTIQQIDRFVESAFFINLSLEQVVEIHLDLIEDLYRNLHLEGFQSNFLSDYRLVLIDIITHLGEMYRSVVKDKCLTTTKIE